MAGFGARRAFRWSGPHAHLELWLAMALDRGRSASNGSSGQSADNFNVEALLEAVETSVVLSEKGNEVSSMTLEQSNAGQAFSESARFVVEQRFLSA
jgi:hypothetical protein